MAFFNPKFATLWFVAVAAVGSTTACKQPPTGTRQVNRTVKASIAAFDPNEDIVLDLSRYGSQRVDEWQVQQAFDQSFGALDTCVAEAKRRTGKNPDTVLPGDVDFAVKLNPESNRPFAVNATLSDQALDKDEALKTCLREAVATVSYPTYDGPPSVAELSTQLDPGFAIIEEE